MAYVVRGPAAALAAVLAAVPAAVPARAFELIAGPSAAPDLPQAAAGAAAPTPYAPTPYAPTATSDYDRGGFFGDLRTGGSLATEDAGGPEAPLAGLPPFDPLAIRFEAAFAGELQASEIALTAADLGPAAAEALEIAPEDVVLALGCRLGYSKAAGLCGGADALTPAVGPPF